ncbi:MAG: hypothetical protein Q9174_007515, partial [Haloplaca sp. 1 TL-2023]
MLRLQLASLRNCYDVIFKDYFRVLGNLWVIARVRPATDQEQGKNLASIATSSTPKPAMTITRCREKVQGGEVAEQKDFPLDAVFGGTTSNEMIADKISPIFGAVVEGLNISIIVDGQSNTGKSYSMVDGPHSIAASAAARIFAEITVSETQGWKWDVRCTIQELYHTGVSDLMHKPGPNQPSSILHK